ncbi:hypothetical protein EST38_g2028 [Candolleomyces aberdarensis]|uniref:AAA+ ATPase domain-containing protein n=1 Tax=Candolleomyces aberdarensis TaxID=2316362 RepID=A0A4Q2DWN6_9AGAR|nr:hypothetical protein EST38_g2028 [Candolleomyces aberdarensis]
MYSTAKSDIFLLPPFSAPWYHFWHGYQRVAFQFRIVDGSSKNRDTVHLRIYTLKGQTAIAEILAEAEAAYRKLDIDNVNIFRISWSPWETTWTRICSKRARPLQSVVLDPGLLESLVGDLKLFMDSTEWYRQRGIPCRRGYLLYGPPGTGKSSLIAAVAAHLELDIYSLSLSSSKLDDGTMSKLLNRIPRRAILLIEDIDAAQRKLANGRRGSQAVDPADEEEPDSDDEGGGITLAGLLNALDGIDAPEGRILFATTNYKESLDPALCRPGRMDVHVKFDMASKYQARELFKRFYPDSEFAFSRNRALCQDEVKRLSPGSSKALEDASELLPLLAQDKDALAPLELEELLSEKAPVPSNSDSDSDSDDFPALHRPPRRNERSRSIQDIGTLATRFAELVPERRFSMASLQEYLMGFRTNPEGACSEEKVREFLRETLPNLATVVDNSSEGDYTKGLGLDEGMNKHQDIQGEHATDTDER